MLIRARRMHSRATYKSVGRAAAEWEGADTPLNSGDASESIPDTNGSFSCVPILALIYIFKTRKPRYRSRCTERTGRRFSILA